MRKRKKEKNPLRMLVLISQIGITMMVPIFFCAWIGYYISRKTGIDILFLIFIVLGILAGFRSCYQIICRFVSLQSSEEGENVRRLKNHEKDRKMDTEHK